MTNQILGILFSFIITLIGLPFVIRIAESIGLFVPNNYRRIHTTRVSALGGLVIFLSASVGFILFSDLINFPDYRFIISSGVLMFFLGFYDDLNEVKPELKLLGQFIAVTLLVVFADVRIDFLQHFFSFSTGLWADTVLTILLMITIINAYNFIDGIDMLAALLGVIIMGILGIWFFMAKQYDYSLALFTLSSALLAFMVFNHSPARIFMGDTGTMTIGIIMAVSLIKFDSINDIIEGNIHVNSAPGIAFAFIALITVDLLRVSFYRIYQGNHPFIADKNHIHHLFLRIGVTQNKASIIISSVVFIQIVMSFYLDRFLFSSLIIIIINLMYLLTFYMLIFIKLRAYDKE
ncbi:MAG: hypothetical protein DRI86_10160 [Bacteroidetes bacterium]|nr:MAG: hypothetical protein DRI86_10160 [Bacteroidota bacterium]